MPRLIVITDENTFKNNLEEYQRRAGDLNYTYDLCRNCACKLDLSILVEKTGISFEWAEDTSGNNVLGKDGQPVWDDHPEYEGTGYECEQCGKELGSRDDADPKYKVQVIS